MDNKKALKVSKYIVSSTMLVNTMAAPIAVFAADNKIDSSYAKAAIEELVNKGILTGNQKGDLQLEGQLTRIQVAAILARALNLDVSSTPQTSFKDVNSDSWGLKYIHALEKIGVMVGSNGQFRPNEFLTKEELATILVRITQTNIVGKGSKLELGDKDQISDWAKDYVAAAIEAGLIPINDGKFAPKSPVKRQDVAVVTNNFMKSEKFEKYKESINTLLDEGKKISNSDPTV